MPEFSQKNQILFGLGVVISLWALVQSASAHNYARTGDGKEFTKSFSAVTVALATLSLVGLALAYWLAHN